MKIYDISVPLQSGMPVWPGDDEPKFEQYGLINEGGIVNSTGMHSPAHIGTHVDAPRHLFNNGKTIEQLSLDILVGEAAVIDLGEVDAIDHRVLSAVALPDCPRLLFKTRNSDYWKSPRHQFQTDFVSLTPDGAGFLVDKQIKLIGIDYLSIDLFNATQLPAHKILLAQEVVVIEGINLLDVPEGKYELYCLPLKIVGADGAPARTILRTNI